MVKLSNECHKRNIMTKKDKYSDASPYFATWAWPITIWAILAVMLLKSYTQLDRFVMKNRNKALHFCDNTKYGIWHQDVLLNRRTDGEYKFNTGSSHYKHCYEYQLFIGEIPEDWKNPIDKYLKEQS